MIYKVYIFNEKSLVYQTYIQVVRHLIADTF